MPVDITKDVIRVRQRDPKLFTKFRQFTLSAAKKIRADYGQLRTSGKWIIQSLIFDREKWNMDTVRSWITSHHYIYPAKESTHSDKLTSPFIIDTVVESHDESFNVLDVAIIKAGEGKNHIFLEQDGQFYTENFPPAIVPELLQVLDGIGMEVYVLEGQEGEKQYVHPSAEINRQTPAGLIPHQVALLKELWIDGEGGQEPTLRAKAVLNQTQSAKDLREVYRTAVEQGVKSIPAPSINGMMLWEPQRRNNRNFFDALKVLSMRSVEFVSRPAAGGAVYAVIEGARMNFFELLKSYCTKFVLKANFDADTPALFLESIVEPNDVLKEVQVAFGEGQDETAAMAALAGAAISAGIMDEGQTTPPATSPMAPSSPPPATPPVIPPMAPTTPAGLIPHQATPPSTPPVSPPTAPPVTLPATPPATVELDGDLEGDTGTREPGMSEQVLEQMKALQVITSQNASTLQQQTSINQMLLKYVENDQGAKREQTMVNMVNEAVADGLPEHRQGYWLQMINAGQIKEAGVLKMFLDGDKKVEGSHTRQVQENFRDLPVATRHLAGITVAFDEAEVPYLRAKQLFQVDCTEEEKGIVTKRGLRAYTSLEDMYQDLCPADPDYTGMPFGGDSRFEQWKTRLITRGVVEGVTSGADTVSSNDFAGIFLQVVGELGVQRWEILDKSAIDLCENGPNFQNYVESNVVVHGAAPDMEEATEASGYPELGVGARQSVTTRASKYGGIMRWSEDVIIDNRLDLINQDVLSQVDATWRSVIRKIIDTLMGWTAATGINTATHDDGNGVIYQAPGTAAGDKRRNYVVGDGREYNILVTLVNYMMQQSDIYKAGQTPQPLTLLPGKVLCETTSWSQVDDNFTMKYKPGTENESNKLRQPNGQTPQVIGVHQSFLHGRSDFVCVIPNPAIHGVIRLQKFRGLTTPSITWQNKPDIGRVFENGELAVKFRFPVRITLLRPKGAYAAFV